MFLTPAQAQARQTASPFKTVIARPAVTPDSTSLPTPDETTLVIVDRSPGRPEGSPNMPIEQKALIGAIANLPGSQKELAAQLDISQAQLSNIKNGKVNGKADSELKDKIQDRIDVINDVAIDKLMMSLGLITPEKLQVSGARVLSGVAKDMSQIVSQMAGKDKPGQQNVIVITNPGVHRESFYEVVEVDAG